jgi:hypothetical protein
MQQVFDLAFGQRGYLGSVLSQGIELTEWGYQGLAIVIPCDGMLTLERAKNMLSILEERHSGLRCRLVEGGESLGWRLEQLPPRASFPLGIIESDFLDWDQVSPRGKPHLEAGHSWWAGVLWDVDRGLSGLKLVVHHLFADAEAMEILRQEAIALMRDEPLGASVRTLRDWVEWERDTWAQSRIRDKTIDHWREASQAQGSPCTPADHSSQVTALFNPGRSLFVADVIVALKSVDEFSRDPKPVIIAASNRWLPGSESVVSSLVQPGVVWWSNEDASSSTTIRSACRRALRTSWFEPLDVTRELPAGLLSSGDGFSWAVNLIHAPTDDESITRLMEGRKEASPLIERFERETVTQFAHYIYMTQWASGVTEVHWSNSDGSGYGDVDSLLSAL